MFAPGNDRVRPLQGREPQAIGSDQHLIGARSCSKSVKRAELALIRLKADRDIGQPECGALTWPLLKRPDRLV